MTWNDWLFPLAPEWILLIGGCLSLLLGFTRVSKWVSPVALATVAAALIIAIRLDVPRNGVVLPGLWVTSLSYYVRWITLGVGSLIVLINWNQPQANERGEYMSMILFSLLGVLLTASANDLIVLFLTIELVSVPTYVLVALSREDARAPEAAVKYFFLGALSAAILAYGISFLYGAAGTTTIHRFVGDAIQSTLRTNGGIGAPMMIGLILVFAGLSFKVAAVPFHAYAADVYEGAASPVTGLLGFVPKLAGFVALCKILAALDWDLPSELNWMLWIVAAATMTVGNVLALLQKNVKRMLAYSSIAHTGYMLIAVLVGPVAGQGPMRDGVSALLFYIVVYGAMNLGAFALLASFRSNRRDVETLDDLGGLARRAPASALALAICIFSLMGFPPTAGFLGKLYIFSSAFSLQPNHPMHGPLIALAIIGVVNTVIGAAYYLRIVAAVYMGGEAAPATSVGGLPVRWGLALCSVPLLVLFAWPTGLSTQVRTATTVLHRSIIRTGGARVTSTAGANQPLAATANSLPKVGKASVSHEHRANP